MILGRLNMIFYTIGEKGEVAEGRIVGQEVLEILGYFACGGDVGGTSCCDAEVKGYFVDVCVKWNDEL